MSQFFITTAIDYSNGDPHIGHAYEKIGADAIARYRRLRGDDVHFLIGMDEHGQKVEQTAAQLGVEPQALVDTLADTFCAMWKRLDISFDQFLRTTDPMHRSGVQALIERIIARSPDDFYEKAYEGWYCVGCEAFKQDAEIVDGKCVLHPTRTLEWVEERNWFFRLSKYSDFLKIVIYHNVGVDPNAIPATESNLILDAIQAVFPSNDPDLRQTLGGLVHHCFISGKVFKDPGDLDNQALIIVPIKILVP